MKHKGKTWGAAALVAWSCGVTYAGTPAAVQADFERCMAQMDRAGRTLREYERTLEQLSARIESVDSAARDMLQTELSSLRSRADFLRNRLERVSGQADKIRDDLANVTGPTCPSCLVSSVILYCRNADAIQNEIENFAEKAASLGTRTQNSPSGRHVTTSHPSYRDRRQSLDSLFARFSPVLDSCSDKAGTVFARQARLAIARTDSLYASGRNVEAEAALDVSESLLRKALRACQAR